MKLFALVAFLTIVCFPRRADQPAFIVVAPHGLLCPFLQCFTASNVVSTLMAVLIGSFSVAQIGPNASAVISAQTAAHKLWKIIDLRPEIDAYADSGAKPAPASLTGSIEFRYVHAAAVHDGSLSRPCFS